MFKMLVSCSSGLRSVFHDVVHHETVCGVIQKIRRLMGHLDLFYLAGHMPVLSKREIEEIQKGTLSYLSWEQYISLLTTPVGDGREISQHPDLMGLCYQVKYLRCEEGVFQLTRCLL